PADSGADDHAEAVSAFEFVDINRAIRDGHFCCGHCKLRKSISPTDVFRVLEEWLRIEIADLPTNLAVVPDGIKSVDGTNAADAILKIRPKRLDIIAKWRDGTETSDNNSAIVVHLTI